MLRIELQTPETLPKEKYIQLHMDAYGKWEEHTPSIVHLWYEEDIPIAFTTINVLSPTSMCLRFMGFTKEYAGNKIKKMAYYQEVLNTFKGMGYQHIIGFVENTNIKALFWAMRAGFRITGLRSRGALPVLLEIILEV